MLRDAAATGLPEMAWVEESQETPTPLLAAQVSLSDAVARVVVAGALEDVVEVDEELAALRVLLAPVEGELVVVTSKDMSAALRLQLRRNGFVRPDAETRGALVWHRTRPTAADANPAAAGTRPAAVPGAGQGASLVTPARPAARDDAALWRAVGGEAQASAPEEPAPAQPAAPLPSHASDGSLAPPAPEPLLRRWAGREYCAPGLAVHAVPEKGRGLITEQPLNAGALVLVARAVAVAPAAELAGLLAEAVSSERTAGLLATLDDGSGEDPPLVQIADLLEGCAPRSLDIPGLIRVNGIRVSHVLTAAGLKCEHEDMVGVWVLPSMLNHSCRPSTLCVPISADTLAFVASRRLEAGAELTTAYVDVLQSRATVQETLLAKFGIERCACDVCCTTAPLRPEKQARLDTLLERAFAFESADDFADVAASFAAAAEKEGWPTAALAPLHLGRAMAATRPSAKPAEQAALLTAAALCAGTVPGTPVHLHFVALWARHAPAEAQAEAQDAACAAWLLRFGGLLAGTDLVAYRADCEARRVAAAELVAWCGEPDWAAVLALLGAPEEGTVAAECTRTDEAVVITVVAHGVAKQEVRVETDEVAGRLRVWCLDKLVEEFGSIPVSGASASAVWRKRPLRLELTFPL